MANEAQVTHDGARHRYELTIDGETALADYHLQDGTVVFTHTGVPPALEGRGIGSRLVKGALEEVRRRGLKVLPACPFVKHFIETHEEFQDLLAD